MARDLVAEREYAQSLDMLRVLAQRDLLSWWKRTAHLSFVDQSRILVDPFHAIVRTYGEQAAVAAADYLFIQRGLDEHLAGLEYPEVADPVGFEQARGSFRWAMNTSVREGGELDRELAKRKLAGIVNRLVAQPARETVFGATVAAGTRFARVPEPGACAFCLMLASRGAVYSRETVVKTGGGREYHDNCRCLGIEVARPADLPQINRDLGSFWWDSVVENRSDYGEDLSDFQVFSAALAARREAVTGRPLLWPEYEHVDIPRYSGKPVSRFFEGEPLPDLGKMPGHVLYGWRDRPDRNGEMPLHWASTRMGHRHDTERKGASKFPKEWSDQKIVDAVRDTIQDPDTGIIRDNGVREVWKRVDGTLIMAKYVEKDDGGMLFISANPTKRIPKRARTE